MISISNISTRTLHGLGWLCYLALLTVSLSALSGFEMAFYKALQSISLHAFLFYSNSLVLMPRFLEKGKYVSYFIFLLSLVILVVGVFYFSNVHIKPFGDPIPSIKGFRQGIESQLLARSGRKGQSSSLVLQRSIMRNFSSVAAIVLLSIVFRMFSQKSAKEKREAALSHEHLLSEMKFLKSQVNPHFLFNALNNIYTLVHLKQDQAATMLMKLSDMLRYMLYECNDEWVPLIKEVAYIKNYIELQQLKTEQPQNIKCNFDDIDGKTLIPPMLLIPFIENSFKHGRLEDVNTGWVTMQLYSSKKEVHFKIINSIPLTPISKDETGGIGLENVRRRLDLLYPNRYNLEIEKTKDEFSVVLNIKSK